MNLDGGAQEHHGGADESYGFFGFDERGLRSFWERREKQMGKMKK